MITSIFASNLLNNSVGMKRFCDEQIKSVRIAFFEFVETGFRLSTITSSL